MLVGTCLYGASEPVAAWLAREIGPERGGGPSDTAIGVIADGKLAGAIGFTNYRPEDKDVTIQAAFRPGVPCRDAVVQAMRYCFDQLGVGRVTAVCVSRNEPGRRFIEWWGFTREGTLHRAFRGEHDLLIYRLTPRAWKRRGIDRGRTYDGRPVAYASGDDGLRVVSWAVS